MVNFAEALNVKAEAVERPPINPLGHFIWKITKYSFDKVGQDGPDGWDVVNFQCQAIGANDDVDPDALSKVGGVKGVKQRLSFMFSRKSDEESAANNQKTLYRLKTFLTEHLGLPEEGKTLKELVDASINSQFLGDIRHRPDKTDPELFFSEIGRTAPLT